MRKIIRVTLASAAILSFASFSLAQEETGLRANLVNDSGKTIGTASFRGMGEEGVLVSVDVSGLPSGWHGVHIHATGDCSDHADHFMKAGAHLGDADEKHGYLNPEGPHDGDLPNVWVAADGAGRAEFFSEELDFASLTAGDGAALMIHAGADDYKTDPSGNSGDRLACGVIGK